MRHTRRNHNSIVTSTLSVLALCLRVYLLASCTKHYDDPGWVASELVDALVAADLKRAKRVTVPEQWDQLETWMDGRKAIRCRGRGADFDDPWGPGGGGWHDAARNEWNYGLVYQCPDRYTPYCLAVNDILIIETEDGWRVASWGRMCEAADLAYKCDEMCR